MAVSGVESLGKAATENVINPATTALRDPNLQQNVSSYVGTFGQKVSEIGSKGFAMASDVATKGYDAASGGNTYSPVKSNNYSPSHSYQPMNSSERDGKIVSHSDDDEWNAWGEPQTQLISPKDPIPLDIDKKEEEATEDTKIAKADDWQEF